MLTSTMDTNTMHRIAKRIEQQQDDEAWAAQNGVQIHACEDGDWMAMAKGRAFGGRTIHEAIGSLRRAIE